MTPHAAEARRLPIITEIVREHAAEAVFLHAVRSALVRAPHVRLAKLRGFDDRLSAHLEGLRVAGGAAKPLCEAALEQAGPGSVFVATIRALESHDIGWLQQLFALAQAVGTCRKGLLSAFGWTSRDNLRGVVSNLLASANSFARIAGLAACSQHRVDPGYGSTNFLEDADPMVRARAYRTAAELGRRELVSRLGALETDQPECRFWACWAAVLLGDQRAALEALARFTERANPFRNRALSLVLAAMPMTAGRDLLRVIGQDRLDIRLVIRGCALVGDSNYIPWLIHCMSQRGLERIAGEAFTLLTGVSDSTWLDLERLPATMRESDPNDDPDDPHVDMDEDDGLPWPDAAKIEAWWHANANRFQPGTRYFMGQPLNRDNCLRVLKEGFQRQRIAAALYLSLLNPGTPLFEWRAPARRQQRLLAEMN